MTIATTSVTTLADQLTQSDIGPRFDTCVKLCDLIWKIGYDHCRTDWERANWIAHYRDYCWGERLVAYDDSVPPASLG